MINNDTNYLLTCVFRAHVKEPKMKILSKKLCQFIF